MAVTRLTREERETTINATDADSLVRIWTAQRKVITALRKKPDQFTEVGAGHYGKTEWAAFVIPLSEVNFAKLAKARRTVPSVGRRFRPGRGAAA